MPLAAFLFITADDLIGVLFGPQWTQAIIPFRWLSLCVVSQPLGNIVGWLYVSQGRARDLMHWGIVGSVIAILSIVGGLPWGIDGVAASYGMTSVVISTPLLFWFAGRKGFVSGGLLGRMFVSKLGYLALFAAGHGLLAQLLQTTSAGALLRLVVHSLVFGAGLTAVFALAPDAQRLRDHLLEAIQARRGRSEP
jgi:PST family polysaccharide transporter